MSRLALLATVIVLGASATHAADPEVVQLGPDTYMITRTSKAGMFTNMSKLKSRVIQQANGFAASKGMIAVQISENQQRPVVMGFPSFEYRFRLVDPDAPEPEPTVAKPDAGSLSDAEPTDTDSESKPDLYTELKKLDELRDEGLLTDEEFEQEKKELLEAN